MFRAVILAVLLIAPCGVAGSMDGGVEVLARKLQTKMRQRYARIAPATSFTNFPLGCVTATQREFGSRHYHAFACAEVTESSGVVLGGVLNKKGRLMCQLQGASVDGCLTIYGCGISRTYC